jgi:hypothetical protein
MHPIPKPFPIVTTNQATTFSLWLLVRRERLLDHLFQSRLAAVAPDEKGRYIHLFLNELVGILGS